MTSLSLEGVRIMSQKIEEMNDVAMIGPTGEPKTGLTIGIALI